MNSCYGAALFCPLAMLNSCYLGCAHFCACSRATCLFNLAFLARIHPCASVLVTVLARHSCVFNLAALAWLPCVFLAICKFQGNGMLSLVLNFMCMLDWALLLVYLYDSVMSTKCFTYLSWSSGSSSLGCASGYNHLVSHLVICETLVDYLWPIQYLVHALLLSDALACPSMLWQALMIMWSSAAGNWLAYLCLCIAVTYLCVCVWHRSVLVLAQASADTCSDPLDH
jgi:hypothetical protein